MNFKPITSLDDAINTTLAFYQVSPEQASRKRTDVDLSEMPKAMINLYDRLGGILDASLNINGYGPLRAGCFDLEYPFTDPDLGLMVMTDSQNGPMFAISSDKSKIEMVGHGPEFYWDAPIEAFLIEYLIDDLKYRLRWELKFPNDTTAIEAFERLKPELTQIFSADIMGGCTYYILKRDILVIHEVWGPDKDRVKCDFGAFHRPTNLPLGAVLEKSQWHDETHAKWANAVLADI